MAWGVKAKKAKAPKPLKGSHPATVKAGVALMELLKVRAKVAILNKRKALLTKIIMEEGCGTAHGYRMYVSHSPARTYWAHKKAYDGLKLIATGGSAGVAE